MGNSAFLQRPSKRSHERTSLLSGAYQIRIARREGSSGGQYPGSQSESRCVSKGLAQGPYAMAPGGVRPTDQVIQSQRRYHRATAPHCNVDLSHHQVMALENENQILKIKIF